MSDNGSNPHISSYRFIIAALAATSFIMAFISRFAWPPMIPVVAPVMNINTTEAMAYMSVFYIGYVVTQIPGGILADRFGPRLVLSVAMAIQGIGTLGIGLTDNYQVGFMLRLLCGLGAGCVYSSCLKAIVTWFSPAQRGLAIGILMTSPTLGIALPNLIMPILNESMGWQGAFRTLGIAILIFSVLTLAMMKEVKTVAAGPRKSFIVGLKYVLSNKNILLVSLAGFSLIWCQIGFGSIANKYMTDALSFSLAEAGRVMTAFGLIGILMPSLAGYLCGKFPAGKKWMLIMCHVLLIAFLLIFGQLSTMTACLVVASVLGCLMGFANPIYSVVIAENAGPEWAATAGGVGNCIFQIAAILSPLAIGMARDATGGFGLTWWILAGGAALGILVSMPLTTKTADS
ncbi:MFS transporter [Deltaproteobacteria bacterium OttesenSCG-928-K17]|nr:MFS transporter [Deltaproteobacteria bacterium OttesenSCG-928-K17]